jgi:hypothetical protein
MTNIATNNDIFHRTHDQLMNVVKTSENADMQDIRNTVYFLANAPTDTTRIDDAMNYLYTMMNESEDYIFKDMDFVGLFELTQHKFFPSIYTYITQFDHFKKRQKELKSNMADQLNEGNGDVIFNPHYSLLLNDIDAMYLAYLLNLNREPINHAESLYIHRSDITSTGLNAIVASLEGNTTLEKLNFSKTVHLSQNLYEINAIKPNFKNTTLREMGLYNNDTEYLPLVIKYLKCFEGLRELDIVEPKMEMKDAKDILSVYSSNLLKNLNGPEKNELSLYTNLTKQQIQKMITLWKLEFYEIYRQHVTQDKTFNENQFYETFKNIKFRMHISGKTTCDSEIVRFWKDNDVIKVENNTGEI